MTWSPVQIHERRSWLDASHIHAACRLPAMGDIVEYPLREQEREGRDKGVGLLVGRNMDRGDAALLPPEALDLCEIEPLRQEEEGSSRWGPCAPDWALKTSAQLEQLNVRWAFQLPGELRCARPGGGGGGGKGVGHMTCIGASCPGKAADSAWSSTLTPHPSHDAQDFKFFSCLWTDACFQPTSAWQCCSLLVTATICATVDLCMSPCTSATQESSGSEPSQTCKSHCTKPYAAPLMVTCAL